MDTHPVGEPAFCDRGRLLRDRRLGSARHARARLDSISAFHPDRRGADGRTVAGRILTPDLQLDLIAVDLRHPAAARVGPAGLVGAPIADLEALEPAAVAEPVRHELAEEPGLEQAVEDHSRQPDALRVSLLVMDLVEVALRTGVLHELARGRMLDQLGQLVSNFDAQRLIAVPRSFATVRPSWLTYSVSKMMKSRLPLEPVFS